MRKVWNLTGSILLTLLILIIPGKNAQAAGSLGLSGVPASTTIGQTFNVTVSLPKGDYAKVMVEYDSSILSLVSVSETYTGGSGNVIFYAGAMGNPNGPNTATVSFKTTKEGSCAIKASALEASDVEGNVISLGGASASIKVENQASNNEGTKSADNSLKELKLSHGQLSPAFKYNVTSYTATVDYSVTSIAITAVPSNAKATIESVTGNNNLKVGENTISIVVKAENGVTATYKIVVTRKSQSGGNEENPGEGENTETPSENPAEEGMPEFSYSGQKFTVAEEIPADVIPQGFTVFAMQIDGKEVSALNFDKGDLQLLYLKNETGYASLYVYDAKEKNVYPFIKLASESVYVIILRPETEKAPEGFKECTLAIEGKGSAIAYQMETNFYLVYCLNSDGEEGWYLYDSLEGTFQRYSENLRMPEEDADSVKAMEDLQKTNSSLKKAQFQLQVILGILLGVVLLLIIGLIIIIVLGQRKPENAEDGELYDSEEENEEAYEARKEEEDRQQQDKDEHNEDAEPDFNRMDAAIFKAADEVIRTETDEVTATTEKEEAAKANAEMFMAQMKQDQAAEPITKDDFDVKISPEDDFPDEEKYEDEDLTIINLEDE